MRGLENEKKVFVAHFDILGMSSVLRKSNALAWELLCDLANATDEVEFPISGLLRDGLSERFFSDTIIISTRGDDNDALKAIIARSFGNPPVN